MRKQKKIFVELVALLSLAVTAKISQAEDLVDSLKAGEFTGQVNIRYEDVEDKSKAAGSENADALTARTAIQYTSADFYNTFFTVEFENVTALSDDDDYFDGPNGGNGAATLPAIIDPEGTEVNQAYIGFKPFAGTVVKIGRQNITPRKAPFHRFMGTVLWRQNWQTQDALTVTNTSLPHTKIMGGYIWNNNFINGQDRDQESPIFNIQYDGFKYGKLEAYYYDLNFTNTNFAVDGVRLGTITYGARASGAYPISDAAKLIYAAEYATQSESDDNPTSYDADYYLAEGGFKFAFKNQFVNSVLAKMSYEVLGADAGAGRAFQTPMGTNHAYQGWADNFLATPNQGIKDTYFTVVATAAYSTKLIIAYHSFESDTGSYDYGEELDIWFTKAFNKKYILGLKYAAYDGDNTTANAATTTFGAASSKTHDLNKFWAYLTVNF